MLFETYMFNFNTKTKREILDKLHTDNCVEEAMVGHTRVKNSNTGVTFRQKSLAAISV